MGALADTYFAKLQSAINDLQELLDSLPPERAAPILAQLTQMETILKHQEPPVE